MRSSQGIRLSLMAWDYKETGTARRGASSFASAQPSVYEYACRQVRLETEVRPRFGKTLWDMLKN